MQNYLQFHERKFFRDVLSKTTFYTNKKKFFPIRLVCLKKKCIFAPTLVSPEGHWGQTLLVKRTFTNAVFYRQISQI
jgi:hypothetical protein